MPTRKREMARIAELLGADTGDMGDDGAAEQAIVAVDRLKREIGIPARLRELGVKSEQLPTMAEKAFAIKRILRVNPRPVTQADIETIFREAL
jgi:alcohol dehydrogenase class IV